MKLFVRAALISVAATALSGCCWGLDTCLACTNCLIGSSIPTIAENTRSDDEKLAAPTVTHAAHMAY